MYPEQEAALPSAEAAVASARATVQVAGAGFGGHSPIASGGQSGHPSPVASRGGGGIRDEELFKATKDFGGLGAPRTPLAQSRTTSASHGLRTRSQDSQVLPRPRSFPG